MIRRGLEELPTPPLELGSANFLDLMRMAVDAGRKFSDLDLVLMTERPLDLGRLADLREAFSESDLPYLVDLIDWAPTSPAFRRIILSEKVVIAVPRPA